MSSAQIVPLSSVRQELLLAYLGPRGFSEAVIRWKYFDDGFNRGRERGFCAVEHDEMVGFIGMIPVELRRCDEVRSDNWLCDWSIRDPLRDKGVSSSVQNAIRR